MFARILPWLSAVVIAGCAAPASTTENAPGLVFPTSLGEGHGDDDDDAPVRAAPAAQTRTTSAPDSVDGEDREAMEHRKKYGSLPDPTPLSSKQQWELTLEYDSGKVTLNEVKRREFEKPVATARRMGRFALELWIGRELIERVRFNFPLVAAAPDEAGPRPVSELPRLDRGATSTQTLLIPDSPRATRLVLVDRATGREHELPWPPRPGGPETTPMNPGQDGL